MLVGDVGYHGTKTDQGLDHCQALDEFDHHQGDQQCCGLVGRKQFQQAQDDGHHLADSPGGCAKNHTGFFSPAGVNRAGKGTADNNANGRRHGKQENFPGFKFPEIGIDIQVQGGIHTHHQKDNDDADKKPAKRPILQGQADLGEHSADAQGQHHSRWRWQKRDLLAGAPGRQPDGHHHQQCQGHGIRCIGRLVQLAIGKFAGGHKKHQKRQGHSDKTSQGAKCQAKANDGCTFLKIFRKLCAEGNMGHVIQGHGGPGQDRKGCQPQEQAGFAQRRRAEQEKETDRQWHGRGIHKRVPPTQFGAPVV